MLFKEEGREKERKGKGEVEGIYSDGFKIIRIDFIFY